MLQGLKLSNPGVYKQDVESSKCLLNGFDDLYEGWGREDDDIAWRLKHAEKTLTGYRANPGGGLITRE